MRKAIQTEATKRAIEYLAQNGISQEVDWDNPKKDDFDIWNALLSAGLLVDRWGQRCSVINRYGPNPHGLLSINAINDKYLGSM